MSTFAVRSHFRRPHRRPRTLQTAATTPRLLADQVGYAVRDLWRSRIAMVFTFLFPLTFLLSIGAIAGNETISADSTVRITQFVTPSAAVMGALYGAFPTVASSLADARERGILKRIRGTPLPMWIHLLGRIVASAVFAFGSLVLMLLVGVIAYDVQIQWARMPATVVTALLAVSCFAALGVAVAGLARSASLAQAASIAVAVVLSFLSGLMGYGDMPAWADRVAGIFPVKHFSDALGEQFDPFATGSGWDLGALTVITAWMVVGVAVATRTLGWQPVHATRARPAPGVPPYDDTRRPQSPRPGPSPRRRPGAPDGPRSSVDRRGGRRSRPCVTRAGCSSPSPCPSACSRSTRPSSTTPRR